MDWTFEPKTGSHIYDEYNGAYGYSIMPYTNAMFGLSGYALYFHNSWRTECPLGEYINVDANLTSIFAEPSMGLREDCIFNTVEDAQFAAGKHRAKGEEPMSYEGWNDLNDDYNAVVEQDKIYHQDREELSKNNIAIIRNIESNRDLELANKLLAQAYLFLNTCECSSLEFRATEISFLCRWCKGCEGCKSDDGYCSEYCLHADDCSLSKFMDKLKTSFKENSYE